MEGKSYMESKGYITGRVNSFQSLGTVDGPGVRSVVFMQGCPLRCSCCHNPDTWSFSEGNEISARELTEKILRFKPYYGKNGGVTLSGGEPMCQGEFVYELFVSLKENGINTCLDTSGCIIDRFTEKILDNTDLVLLDYKYSTDEDYRKYVGCGIEKIIAFLELLERKAVPTVIRRVIIPGYNTDEFSIADLSALSKKYSCIKDVELLPFRTLCKEKYDNLGLNFPFRQVRTPTEGEIAHIKAAL